MAVTASPKCLGCNGLAGEAGALVPVSPVPDWATWSSGGPISHGTATVTGRWGQDVYPGGDGGVNAFQNEPGALWTGRAYRFNENGVVMLGDAPKPVPALRLALTSSIGPTVTMALGAGMGAVLSPQKRVLGTVIGALAGGILGIIFNPG